MNTGIYYFTGTGNSLRIARGLKERLIDAKIIPIIPLLNKESIIPKAESIGIIFPIQSFSYPWVAAEFIRKLDLSQVDYIFAISSRYCFNKVFRDLEKVRQDKRKFNFFDMVFMPQNYIPIFRTFRPEEIEETDRQMEEKLDIAAKMISKKETHRPKNSLLWFPVSNVIFPLFTGFFRNYRLPDMGRSFYADEKCNGCGTCEKVCLADRIKMVNDRPDWLDDIKCTYCFACLHLCPNQSVQIKGRNTEKKDRYNHPTVTVQDIIDQKKVEDADH
jgi:ferredoxin